MTNEELIGQAKSAAQYAYAPYSGFAVGAAVLAEDGTVHTGCNIENASYGATMCAERTAIFKAVSEGKRNLCRIAVVAANGQTAYPCGMCRQVMAEFMPEGEVLLEEQGEVVSYTVQQLLPLQFTL